MQKSAAILGSALFFLIAPFTLGFVVPWWIAGWRMAAPDFDAPVFRFAGLLLAVVGVVPLIESFGRFALVGLGTPAPIAPTRHLVVTGFYRYVRNPMYVGVLTIILGNALISGEAVVFEYAAVIALGFALFVLFYEEPTLRRQFGDEYIDIARMSHAGVRGSRLGGLRGEFDQILIHSITSGGGSTLKTLFVHASIRTK
jgi:protein-S-isoprenylcysteine O-methyltransferase Ste14